MFKRYLFLTGLTVYFALLLVIGASTFSAPAAQKAVAQDVPAPTSTPAPVTRYEFSMWRDYEIPAPVRNGLTRPHVAFINANDSDTTSLATAAPTGDLTVLYYVDPNNANNLYPIIEFSLGTLERVFVSPLGNTVAYLLNDRAGSDERGLWLVDVSSGFGARVINESSLSVRGLSQAPTWSPDGRRMAMVWETGYSADIFEFNLDRSVWGGLVISDANNFWPTWSPDGQWLAFVSDRVACPSWVPGTPDACDHNERALTGGHVYVLNMETGATRRISEEETFEPPYWLDDSTLAFTAGDSFDIFDPSRTLWLGDMSSMGAEQISLSDSDATLYLAERWTPDGAKVAAQVVDEATNTTEIVIFGRDGERINTVTAVSFSRYAMDADWSAAGDRLALGGTSGQCPSSLRVLNENYAVISNFNIPTNVCAPRFAPDDSRIVFTGVSQDRSAVDGRRDIYVSSRDGLSAINLTLNLRGQMSLIGWVGPS